MQTDTSQQASDVQIALLRASTRRQRLATAVRLTSDVLGMTRRAIQRRHPKASPDEVNRRFAQLHYHTAIEFPAGRKMAGAESEMIVALRGVLEQLQHLGIRHYVGGSIAGSCHGVARSTLDVDVVAELEEASVKAIIAAVQHDYYVSESAALAAVKNKSCFNLIHLGVSYKVDLFVSQDRPFDRSVLERAQPEELTTGTDAAANKLMAPIATAEDILLLKLEWYQLGNQTSERQWSDVELIANLQGEALDIAYLEKWALSLGVEELLQKLLGNR